jgi:hypothetical protein
MAQARKAILVLPYEIGVWRSFRIYMDRQQLDVLWFRPGIYRPGCMLPRSNSLLSYTASGEHNTVFVNIIRYKYRGDGIMEMPYMSYPFAGQYYAQPYITAQQTAPYQQPMMMQGYPVQYAPVQYTYTMDDDVDYIDPMLLAQQDPPPLISNNPVTASVSLFKELSAYPNYGNPSRNADILYTGNRGSWTFQSPSFFTVPGNQRAQVIIRAVLDDHANVPVNRYSARITINGTVVHDGRLLLEHGAPAGGMFTNWRDLPFNIFNTRRTNRVTIENTSSVGTDDRIAFDWMEIRLLPI